ncbi:hypothetical protein O181_078111 [Austropuccinia psidii MF-1]|uniref:Uncharacterized protein n=1 Tax=Austropuccinia psidii MF-1 TaxID=1389203 RepID=A0A9Q3FDN7_9BASI|nr:hypothetical protein [Austropuccinia psidii MF-1]
MSWRDIFQGPYGNYEILEYKQEVQALRRAGSQYKGESSHNPGYRGAMEPERAYSDSFRITRSRTTQLSSSLTPLIIQKAGGQESSFFTITGRFQEKTSTNGK